jgi:hypothetical protein
LTTLEAAKPDLQLSERIPFYVIPAHTIQILESTPHFVTQVGYRESNRRRFERSLEQLSPRDLRDFKDILATTRFPEELEASSSSLAGRSVHVIDSLIDYFDYKFSNSLLRDEPKAMTQKKVILDARAELGPAPLEKPASVPFQEAPGAGHAPRRAGISFGQDSRYSPFVGLQFRFALQDLLDPITGYPKNASIEFLNINARYYLKERLELESLNFFQVESLNPIQSHDFGVSWRVRAGLNRIRDPECLESHGQVKSGCLTGNFSLAGGGSIQPFRSLSSVAQKTILRPLTAFALLETSLQWGSTFKQGIRPVLSPVLGLTFRESDLFSFLFEVSRQRFFLSQHEWGTTWGLEARVSPVKNWSLGFRWDEFPASSQGTFSVYHYL